MTADLLWALFTIAFLAFFQSVSFSIVSRSRNRSNLTYHMIASVFSNGVWFLTFRELVKADMSLTLFVPYTIGTVAGSLTGVKISMWIESWLCAGSDEHIKPKMDKYQELSDRVRKIEDMFPSGFKSTP
jgi:hypothetical protein